LQNATAQLSSSVGAHNTSVGAIVAFSEIEVFPGTAVLVFVLLPSRESRFDPVKIKGVGSSSCRLSTLTVGTNVRGGLTDGIEVGSGLSTTDSVGAVVKSAAKDSE
jgi:hypothetical protein